MKKMLLVSFILVFRGEIKGLILALTKCAGDCKVWAHVMISSCCFIEKEKPVLVNQHGLWEMGKQNWDLGDPEWNPTVIHRVCSGKSFNSPSLCFSSGFSVQTLQFCGCLCWDYGVGSMLGLLDTIAINFHWMKKKWVYLFFFLSGL